MSQTNLTAANALKLKRAFVESQNAKDLNLDNDWHCIMLIGGQNVAKSLFLSRTLGIQLPTDNERCTKAFYEFTMINNETQKGYRVRIAHENDILYSGNLDLDSAKGRKILHDHLKAAQDKIGKQPEYEDKHFYNTTIKIEIESSKINESFTIYDTPGVIQMNEGRTDDSAVAEIHNALKEITLRKKRVTWLVCHDATKEIDNCEGLKFLSDNDVDKKNIHLILGKCDRMMDEDRSKLVNMANGVARLKKENIHCVTNRTNEMPNPFTSEQEKAWFENNIPEITNFGVQRIREVISREAAISIVDFFKNHTSILEDALQKKTAEIEQLENHLEKILLEPFQIIEKVKKLLEFIREAKISHTVESKELQDIKEELKTFYTDRVEETFGNLYNKLYTEKADEDYDQEDSLEKSIHEHRSQMTGAASDILTFRQIFNVLCEKLVASCRDDQSRKFMIEEILSTMWASLKIIAETYTENMPKMRAFLIEYFQRNHKEVEKKFSEFVNVLQFNLYTQTTPYNKMTGEKLNLESKYEFGELIAVKDLEDAINLMIEQAGVYVKKAFVMFEMNTAAAMRMTVIFNHSKQLAENLSKEYHQYLSQNKIADEDMTKNEKETELKEDLENLKKERDFIKSMIKSIDDKIH